MRRLFSLGLICVLAYACNRVNTNTIIDGFALGTTYHIVICGDTIPGTMAQINSKFDQVNESMSIYNKDSRLSKINRNQSSTLDSLLLECLSLALMVSEQSDGMYDVTIKPLTDAWGFATKQKTADPNVDSLLKAVGYSKIKIEGNTLIKQNPNTQIDLNSIAKGSTVDLIAKTIENMGHSNYLVEIGGEIVVKGINTQKDAEWVIGIDKPEEGNMFAGSEIINTIALSDQALATSGNYRRYYTSEQGEKVVHTINPKTGYSTPSNLLSATVIAENCALADAYATTLMALGVEGSKEFLNRNTHIKAYLIFSDKKGEMQFYTSENL